MENGVSEKEMTSNKKLINLPENAVNDSLQGFVAANPHQIRQLEGWPRVIVRADLIDFRHSNKVAVVAGGGSGHEPSFAGFVGRGMFTASVAGSVFTSPPTSTILAALKAVAGPAGTIITVINYTGDRLNFGLAAERFMQLYPNSGPVRVVVCGDDTALMSKDKSAGRRGIAGSLMVMKMIGALCESGKLSCDQIADFGVTVSKQLGTIGLSLSSCSLPGQPHIFHLESDQMELGLGIHGEPGVRRIKLLPAKETINEMLMHMTRDSAAKLELEKGQEVAVLINNLGGLSQIEVNIVCKETLEWLNGHGIQVKRLYVGTLMTSLEMQGISISVLRLVENEWTRWLDAETGCVSWPVRSLIIDPNYSYDLISPLNLPDVDLSHGELPKTLGTTEVTINGDISEKLKQCVLAACQVLIDCESELNRLDQAAGDGDCGVTMRYGAQAVINAAKDGKLQFGQPSLLLRQISEIWEENTGGATGAIYALFLSSAASKWTMEFSPKTVVQALKYATESVMKYGHAEPGDRTMVDALYPACKALDEKTADLASFQQAVEAAESGVEATIHMLAKAGRASYVSRENLTLPDPGAKAVALWLRAVFEAYKK